MKNIINIFLYDENDCEYSEIYERKYGLDIDEKLNLVLNLNICSNVKYCDFIKDYTQMQRDFKKDYELQKLLPIEDEIDEEQVLSLYKKYIVRDELEYKKLFDENEYIYISGEYKDLVKFLNNNKDELKDKKIVINRKLYLSESKDIEFILNNFSSFNNLYFMLEGNIKIISLEELSLTYKSIKTICEKIRKYNLSPLEVLVFVYDLVRNREYKKEEENEDAVLSRDLTKVLLGDKIVCVGFANVFDAVLKSLGFSSKLDMLSAINIQNPSHARNTVYLKDNKYGVEGIFYFDPTFDCKKEDGNAFLNSFKCFARNKNYMEYNYGKRFRDLLFEKFNVDFVGHVEDIINKQGIENLSNDDVIKINDISKFIDGDNLIDREILFKLKHNLFGVTEKDLDGHYIIKRLYEYLELFESIIPNKILMDAIYNVRKIEYYENNELYSLDLNDFYEIYKNSHYGFCINPQNRLLASIFGFNSGEDISIDEYIEDRELEKGIESVKLVKVLRNVYEKRK